MERKGKEKMDDKDGELRNARYNYEPEKKGMEGGRKERDLVASLRKSATLVRKEGQVRLDETNLRESANDR
jgi:hypothetical protein